MSSRVAKVAAYQTRHAAAAGWWRGKKNPNSSKATDDRKHSSALQSFFVLNNLQVSPHPSRLLCGALLHLAQHSSIMLSSLPFLNAGPLHPPPVPGALGQFQPCPTLRPVYGGAIRQGSHAVKYTPQAPRMPNASRPTCQRTRERERDAPWRHNNGHVSSISVSIFCLNEENQGANQ